MLSDEEKEKLEQARSNITRGVDIESAMLILEKCALDGIIFTGGRVNIFKIAVRQILNFLEEYKDKKVKANEIIEKQSKEIQLLKEQKQYVIEEYGETIEKQSKEIEELKEDNKKKSIVIIEYQDLYEKLVDKIKAKIEENKWAIEHYDCDEADYKQSQAVGAWNVLQRLLKESEIWNEKKID